MKINILFILLNFSTIILAQTNKIATGEANDPKAKKILDAIKKQYDSYKNFELEFTMEIEGEKKKEIQKGKLTQMNEKYRLDMPNQILVSDAKSTWYYLKKKNEVQINSVSTKSKDQILSPKTIMNAYQDGKYIFAITSEGTENNKKVNFIEFKPKDRNSDITKLRLAINKADNSIVSLRTFNRDGSRILLKINQFKKDLQLDSNIFTFDASKYPNIKIEDLRID